MHVPDGLRYTSDHEWARREGNAVRVGITDFAQDSLGDVVFVQLPEPGAEVTKGSVVGEVESTKSVSDIYSPVGGVVVEVNTELADAPERLNEDPYGEGWIYAVEMAEPGDWEELLDAEAYRQLIAG